MSVAWRLWGNRFVVTGCLATALQSSLAQKTATAASKAPAAGTVEATREVLLGKARALESRGRPDMAVQLWQQILLAEPNNTEALAGVARDLKLEGASADRVTQALDQLKRVNPNDPNIARIEALSSTKAESAQLKQAGELAQQGKLDEAMKIYLELYRDRPPDGDIALAYYQTLYGTKTGKQAAIAGMRAAAARNPGDTRFIVSLGVMLTYDAQTRPEGIRILEAHPSDPDAQAGLRQALIWDAANPNSAAELRAYLKDHPSDTEIANHLKEDEAQLAQMNSGIARTPAEIAAFGALNAKRLDEAEKRFDAILKKDPKDGRADAGMGFLRMQQKNFSGAVSYLTQAGQNGYKSKTVDSALSTSRFWFTMGEASQAFDGNQFALAETKYKAALDLDPQSPDALNGLAGLYLKQEQFSAAAGIYEQLIKVQPANIDGWRGLFISYARQSSNQQALDLSAHFPASVTAALNKDPDYLRTLASIYQAMNRPADADKVLALALALPFPDNGATLPADTKLEYAALLTQARRYGQAAALYVQILNTDPGNVTAWEGLIGAHHNLNQDEQALADVKKMSAATYETALADSAFLSELAAIYQSANQLEVAQGLLERSERLQLAAGTQPSADLELQLASIYLLRNDTDRAYPIYRRVLAKNPTRADAWEGLISTLQATNRTSEAVQEIALIPAPVRTQLETDVTFVQMEAGLYAASGDLDRAAQQIRIVQAHYANLKQQPPADVQVQNAWLLYNTNNDRALYPTLMQLGSRGDLTATQRETVENIWANWSVRRATEALQNNDAQRAAQILDAALQAFPDNLAVRKAVAGGYVQVGRAKEALAIFKTVPMGDATAADYQGAVGAALAADDKAQAELWLRQALDRFPRDPGVLALAAQYEQARGDNERAAAYYRASLAAMPAVTPADQLAHKLVNPEQNNRPQRAVTAADLQQLLNPDTQSFPKTIKLPPLPSLGYDPMNGAPPVIPAQPTGPSTGQPVPQPQPTGNAPASQAGKPTKNNSNPAVMPIPNARFEAPAVDQTPQPVSSGGTGAILLGVDSLGAPGLGAEGTPQAGQAPLRTGSAAGNISADPPHSTVSDRWKGLILSETAGKQYQQALADLKKIPPDVRALLEMDIDFVQGVANLYAAVGDRAQATAYFNRVEEYYQARRANTQAQPSPRSGASSNAPSYTGKMNLPSSEENVDSVTALPSGNETQNSRQLPSPAASSLPAQTTAQRPRLSSQPQNQPPGQKIDQHIDRQMDQAAAQAQALFAAQTDSQLTQGSPSVIHAVPNTAVAASPTATASPSGEVQYNVAQYTPSAQEAATGAYSASAQQQSTSASTPAKASKPSATPTRKKVRPATKTTTPVPTLATAPGLQTPPPAAAPAQQQVAPPAEPAPAQTETTQSPTGLSDQELQQQNLPPLRGPWVRVQRQAPTLSPRDQVEQQLQAIESGYSGWLGGTGLLNDRSGNLGYDHLAALEAPFEASMPMGYHARLTVVAKPIFLDSGQADGTATINVLESTTPGAASALTSILEPIGTLIPTATSTPPAQQNAVGLGGEVQLGFPHLAIAGGYTGAGFLVATFTARANWRPANGPITITFARDSIKDSQLSYSGLRDPAGTNLGNQGQIWGGVVSNQGNIQFGRGDAQSGYYFAVGGQYIQGYEVEHNSRIDGTAGAYWRAFAAPEYGNLSIGANFFAMHYADNQDAFTHGMGGYFSPQSYFLANIPFTWVGHYQTHWHYTVLGAVGVQAFQENSTPLFPLLVDKANEIALGSPMLPSTTSVGPNYDLRGEAAYQIGPHWFVGGYLSANNTRNYVATSPGFFVRYTFREQPSTATAPTGLFPTDGLRPFTVP